jgi:predicted nucleic acid-binding protein
MYYFDSTYVAKCYLNDPDSDRVHELVRQPVELYSSALCIPEVSCAIHRRYREHLLSRKQAQQLFAAFRAHVEGGTWSLVPISEGLLWDVHEALRRLNSKVFLRSGDAIQLVSAQRSGFGEIWTNDRHMLEAAPHFRLRGRTV